MHDTILALAQSITGAADTEASLLALLCTASEQAWTDRLKDGLTPSACETAFVCACAFSSAAGLLSSRGSSGAFSSFTALGVSVGGIAPAETAAAVSALYQQAEHLMAAYVDPDDFAFRGVKA